MIVEIPVRVSFLKHTLTCKNPGIVEGDYNTTKLVFTFDEDIDATKVLFKLSNPQKEVLFLKYLDESNSVLLTSYDEGGNPCSLFGAAGLYPFELVWQTVDSKLTSAPGFLNASARQVAVIDNTVHEYFPLFETLMKGSRFIFFRFSAYPDGTDFTAGWSEDQDYVGFATSGVDAIPQDKSKYTWCKLRGKPGAAPYIGENGNWWVEGKDTGVSPKVYDEKPICSCGHSLTLDPALGLSPYVGYEVADADTYYTIQCKNCGAVVYRTPGIERHDEAESGISYTNGSFAVSSNRLSYYILPQEIIGSDKSCYKLEFTLTLNGLNQSIYSSLYNNGGGRNLLNCAGTWQSILRQLPIPDGAGGFLADTVELCFGKDNLTYLTRVSVGSSVKVTLYAMPGEDAAEIYIDGMYRASFEKANQIYLSSATNLRFGDSTSGDWTISNISIVSIDPLRVHEASWETHVRKLAEGVYQKSETYSKQETYHKNEVDTKLGKKAPMYTFGTENIEAGSASTEPNGTIHFVYV
jgi:hypothetical protein